MKKPTEFPEQHQDLPGYENEMKPKPEVIKDSYKGNGKLKEKTVLITGGDSGIGRSAAVHAAREGANLAIIFLSEEEDAKESQRLIEYEGAKCILLMGDIRDREFCKMAVKKVVEAFGKVDVLINNAAIQHPKDSILDIEIEDLKETFETNIYSFFYLVQEILPQMTSGDSIINTTSVTAYEGNQSLIDYSSTKGAIMAFTRSLSQSLASKGIRVNAVAPGPIWTPLIVATFEDNKEFGQDTPMQRAGQPSEVGPAFVFLASEDSSYMTGQVLHINGGKIIGG
ncbi:SDR family oxidoreductase [Belliella sp. DSM 111904]|uniref:SDR family oxidoreductase n=1 Tax=Belliella filtrata TaxID=2923435 RepID=A0ABS9UXI9_9BACT|nr:SDR family oxidoreductase [Belliella filtrata]MCH7408430.1 SDR family oxidoreductase [Belliella filtrata]